VLQKLNSGMLQNDVAKNNHSYAGQGWAIHGTIYSRGHIQRDQNSDGDSLADSEAVEWHKKQSAKVA